MRFVTQPGIQAFNLDQLQARQESKLTELKAEIREVSVQLAHFIDTEKIRPSRLSIPVLLFAMLLLGSQGSAKNSSAAQAKAENVRRGDEEVEDNVGLGGEV